MSRKPKRGEQTLEQIESDKRGEALREKAQRIVLSSKPPTSQHRIPKALQQCDNADITKRNTSRKKKYLFLFPGALQLPPGARIGQLHDLNTTNPTLCVDVDGGKIVMCGTLVLPKNAFFTLKAGNRRREVKVVDSLDTIVAFSEWRFVKDGVDLSEACTVPSTLIQNAERGLWKSERSKAPVRKSRDDEDGSEELSEAQASREPVKSNPRRIARVKDYLEADVDSEELGNGEQVTEELNDDSKVIEHINLVDDEDDVTELANTRLQQNDATNTAKQLTETTLTGGRRTSNRGRSRGRRGRLKRLVAGSEDDKAEVGAGDNASAVQGRSSGRKRKKITYTQSDDGSDDNVSADDDEDDDYDFGADEDF